MKNSWTWQEAFRFALSHKLYSKNKVLLHYNMAAVEKYGSLCLEHFYILLDQITKQIRKPVAICLFTLLASILSLLIFYNFPGMLIIGKIFPYQTIRFLFFLYTEAILFCIGCRACSRFNNQALIHLFHDF